jgi:hypothetical protein
LCLRGDVKHYITKNCVHEPRDIHIVINVYVVTSSLIVSDIYCTIIYNNIFVQNLILGSCEHYFLRDSAKVDFKKHLFWWSQSEECVNCCLPLLHSFPTWAILNILLKRYLSSKHVYILHLKWLVERVLIFSWIAFWLSWVCRVLLYKFLSLVFLAKGVISFFGSFDRLIFHRTYKRLLNLTNVYQMLEQIKIFTWHIEMLLKYTLQNNCLVFGWCVQG